MQWSMRPAMELVTGDIISWHGNVHKVGSTHYAGTDLGEGIITICCVDGLDITVYSRRAMRHIAD